MMNLLKNIINIIPLPIWICTNNDLTYMNNEFMNFFNVTYFNVEVLSKCIKVHMHNNSIDIPKKDSSFFLFNESKYIHKVFNDFYNDDNIEVGIIFHESLKNIPNGSNSLNILETIINNVPELIFYKDIDGVYRGANNHCIDFYKSNGINNVIGKTDKELPLDKDFIDTCRGHDRIVLETKKPLYIEEVKHTDTGALQFFETVKTPVMNKKNEVWGIVGVVRDITRRKIEEKKLRYLSYTDVLTGLYNRAFFNEKISELINAKQYPIGIIMGDINGLKLVNDTFGHIEGDNLIISVAQALKSKCKNNESIFRWGGDEFIVLIPNSNEENCENLIREINLFLSNSKDNRFRLSMSMGTSMITNESINIDDALKEAENKLYREKILVEKSIRSSIIATLKESLQAKNVETEEHTERVLNYSLKIGQKLNLKKEELSELALVAKLHDIGKIAIPENILLKSTALTDDEYEIMKTHAEKGYRLALSLPELSHIARGILTHHEKWDGSGYPLGLCKNEIPLTARIVSVVDAFDAMTSNRSYNIVKSINDAINELKKHSGKHFDPDVVKVFCEII